MIDDTNLNPFLSYDLLNISPQQVFKPKMEQELAIFELSKGIAYLIKEKEPSAFQEICSSLDETCDNLRK